MSEIGLFYGSSTGHTESVAEKIKTAFGDRVVLCKVDRCTREEVDAYTYLIMGISTWGEGELQDDWEAFFPQLDTIDFSQKRVALFGLGDQEEYGEYFLNAMGTLCDKLLERGAGLVGVWPTDGYSYEESTAERNGEFVGLAIDEVNQDDLTDGRIASWVEQIRPYFDT
jgi:flavodoxin I